MLRYINYGWRDSSSHSPASKRVNWEFYFILEGTCTLFMPDGTERLCSQGDFFAFRPKHQHGWKNFKKCKAAAMHFSIVPSAFEEWMQNVSWCHIVATKDEVASTQLRLAEIQRHYISEYLHSTILFEIAVCEFCLMMMKGEEIVRTSIGGEHRRKVDEALSWFEGHLRENPKVETVASAMNISSTQLRRLFRTILKQSPKQAFDVIRIRRAKELMAESVDTLDLIAKKSGFTDASELCRVFHRVDKGLTPSKWRKFIIAPE